MREALCECEAADNFFADASYRCPDLLRVAAQASASQHPGHFQSKMMERSRGSFIADRSNRFRCRRCNSSWYLEFAPEESELPIFGVKLPEHLGENRQITPEALHEFVAKYRAAAILLLLGRSTQKCSGAKCSALALNGVALCENHHRFPWY
jgi:hypothetical protein